eukprot:27859_1
MAVIGQQQFSSLPSELRDIIFNMLPLHNQMKSLLTLNNQTYTHFIDNHYREINLINQLQSFVSDPSSTHHISRLELIVKVLRWSELYSLKLPQILININKSNHLWIQKRINLNALNIHSMRWSELKQLSKYNQLNPKLLCLILASRTLVHYFVHYDTINPNDYQHNPVVQGLTDKNLYYSEYPWIIYKKYGESVTRPIKLDMISFCYFSYLYEYFFDNYYNELEIPKLNEIYQYKNKPEYNHVEELMDKFGFILWNRYSLYKIRTNLIRTLMTLNGTFEFLTNSTRIHVLVYTVCGLNVTNATLSTEYWNYVMKETANNLLGVD